MTEKFSSQRYKSYFISGHDNTEQRKRKLNSPELISSKLLAGRFEKKIMVKRLIMTEKFQKWQIYQIEA